MSAIREISTAPITTTGPDMVSRTLDTMVTRNDDPVDGGWGDGYIMSAAEIAIAEYRRNKLAQVLGSQGLPPETEVVWGSDVPYAGEGPEPSFRRPGFRGEVVYRQDNGRATEDRMVASIRWIPTESAPNAPA